MGTEAKLKYTCQLHATLRKAARSFQKVTHTSGSARTLAKRYHGLFGSMRHAFSLVCAHLASSTTHAFPKGCDTLSKDSTHTLNQPSHTLSTYCTCPSETTRLLLETHACCTQDHTHSPSHPAPQRSVAHHPRVPQKSAPAS